MSTSSRFCVFGFCELFFAGVAFFLFVPVGAAGALVEEPMMREGCLRMSAFFQRALSPQTAFHLRARVCTVKLFAMTDDQLAARFASSVRVSSGAVPKFSTMIEVDPECIPGIIGTGGAIIREIQSTYNVNVDIPRNSRDIAWPQKCPITIKGSTSAVNVDAAKRCVYLLTMQRIHETPLFKAVPLPSSVQRIYMDGSNYGSSHFFVNDDWSISRMVNKVEEFVLALKAQGVVLVVFFDNARVSTEANNKRDSRILRDVSRMQKNYIQSGSWMLFQAFARFGVEIRGSEELDNDDTLAYYAHHDQAAVLSRDQDFFRYRIGTAKSKPSYIVYENFRVTSNGKGASKVELALAVERHRPDVKLRALASAAPRFQRSLDNDWSLNKDNPEFFGGNPSPLVQELGNPHSNLVAGRAAVYFKQGVKVAVRERIAEWRGNEAVFVHSTVEPDESDLGLLEGPVAEAFQHYFPKEAAMMVQDKALHANLAKHILGCYLLVMELCHAMKLGVVSTHLMEMEEWEAMHKRVFDAIRVG
jgi:hypothetical protein